MPVRSFTNAPSRRLTSSEVIGKRLSERLQRTANVVPLQLVGVLAHERLELVVRRARALDRDDAVEAEHGEETPEDLAPGDRPEKRTTIRAGIDTSATGSPRRAARTFGSSVRSNHPRLAPFSATSWTVPMTLETLSIPPPRRSLTQGHGAVRGRWSWSERGTLPTIGRVVRAAAGPPLAGAANRSPPADRRRGSAGPSAPAPAWRTASAGSSPPLRVPGVAACRPRRSPTSPRP